jgi:hypothetical protein
MHPMYENFKQRMANSSSLSLWKALSSPVRPISNTKGCDDIYEISVVIRYLKHPTDGKGLGFNRPENTILLSSRASMTCETVLQSAFSDTLPLHTIKCSLPPPINVPADEDDVAVALRNFFDGKLHVHVTGFRQKDWKATTLLCTSRLAINHPVRSTGHNLCKIFFDHDYRCP